MSKRLWRSRATWWITAGMPSCMRPGPSRGSARADVRLRAAVAWYFGNLFGRIEGGGILPYYCDTQRVGRFAVRPDELARGAGEALFRLCVGMAMFQARRDVVIMRQQRMSSAALVRRLTSPSTLRRAIGKNGCPKLASPDLFDLGCDVARIRGAADCGLRPGAMCHVKEATIAFNRTGDMGKLPTSAWLRLWKAGGFRDLLRGALAQEREPTRRAALLVNELARVHRVGRKLATMFVSALSTPALAPGLTPWFPEVDGNELVVIDTNVARGVDALRGVEAPRTYAARERWIKEEAAKLDLKRFRRDVPSFSPRLVQQALYSFCSKSNRAARGDGCVGLQAPCASCAPALCPFALRAGS